MNTRKQTLFTIDSSEVATFIPSEATCPVCGCVFTKKRSNQRVCSDSCKKIYWNEYNRVYQQLYHNRAN